jgi:hypothetical protein
MASNLVKNGELPITGQLLPNRTITERNDGTLEGVFVIRIDKANRAYLPEVGDTHPDDDRLEIHSIDYTVTQLGLLEAAFSCLGLVDDPTDPVISYTGTPDRESVVTHPDFVSVLAGRPSAPKNGALFVHRVHGRQTEDDNLGQFESFSTNVNSELYGVQYYLAPSTQITLTWWQTDTPTIERMKIIDKIDGDFKTPADVENFLILDTPYRQIGSHFQVTQIILGSGKGGWSELLYPQE